MIIGVPVEIKRGEFRIGLTPQAVAELMKIAGVQVVVEEDAGLASGYDNKDYQRAGASIVPGSIMHAALSSTDMIVKVKEPEPIEYFLFQRKDPSVKAIAGFFHFAANPGLKEFFYAKNIRYLDYGDVTDASGGRPILAAMSKIAGESAVLEGFAYLRRSRGGRGVMPKDAVITIVGLGGVGRAALDTACGLGVKGYYLFDNRIDCLAALGRKFEFAYLPTAENILKALPHTDLLIGSAAKKGEAAPKILTREMIRMMPKGSVLVDVAIDEGGSSETSRPTKANDPTYVEEGVIHYCVPNIPGSVPRTASPALSRAALPHLKKFIATLAESQ